MEYREPIAVILSHLPERIRALLERSRNSYAATAQEITLRAGRPLCIYCRDARYYLTASGMLTSDLQHTQPVAVTDDELHEVFMSLCEYSVYARQDELIRGYLTASSGVRVGVCGTAVLSGRDIVGVRHITTLSFRIPREVKGCSREVLQLIDPLHGALVCGPPCSGKTTIIRDMARVLSYRCRVSVIDERGELAAASPSGGYDLGLSDIYVRLPKGEGIICAVRSMAPDVIVCDELGDESDADAVRYALRCGVALIATVHAADPDDLRHRAATRELLATGAFRYLVFLGDRRGAGRVTRIYEWGRDSA